MSNRFLSAKNTEINHAVILLASGLSQRLGRSKQLLVKNSEPLISYMLKLALATQAKTIIIVIPQQNVAINSNIETTIDSLEAQNSTIQIVSNPNPESGMAQSLSLGIDALITSQNTNVDRVLIMGIDQILLNTEHLSQLLAEESLVVASHYPHLEDNFAIDNSKPSIIGLPIAIDYNLLKSWQAQLTGDKGLRHLIRALAAEQISTVINSQLSYDIDTPEQLAYAQQQGWLDH